MNKTELNYESQLFVYVW